MKRTILTLVALFALASVSTAGNLGTTFGLLTTAKTLDKGQTTVGGRLGIADGTSYSGSVAYGIADNADVRLQIGALDQNAFETGLVFGGDFKWQLSKNRPAKNSRARNSRSSKKSSPIDFALGGFFEYGKLTVEGTPVLIESMSVFQIGAQLIASHTTHMKSGSTLTPYGRINIRNETLSVDLAPLVGTSFDISASQLALGLNGGIAYGLAGGINLFGEFQIDGNDGFFFGVDFDI